MATKPAEGHIDWTDGDAAKVADPGGAKKLLGWQSSEKPSFKFMNFLLYVLDKWAKYFEEVTDNIAFSRIDAIVNTDANKGTHTSLQAAHDDSTIVAGSTILITSDLLLNTTVQISKSDIEIKMVPGKRLKKGGSAPSTNFTGLRLIATADRCRLVHVAIGSATGAEKFGGSGDKALEIQSGCANVLLLNPVFVAGNTQDLDDQGTATAISAAQSGLSQ